MSMIFRIRRSYDFFLKSLNYHYYGVAQDKFLEIYQFLKDIFVE